MRSDLADGRGEQHCIQSRQRQIPRAEPITVDRGVAVEIERANAEEVCGAGHDGRRADGRITSDAHGPGEIECARPGDGKTGRRDMCTDSAGKSGNPAGANIHEKTKGPIHRSAEGQGTGWIDEDSRGAAQSNGSAHGVVPAHRFDGTRGAPEAGAVEAQGFA